MWSSQQDGTRTGRDTDRKSPRERYAVAATARLGPRIDRMPRGRSIREKQCGGASTESLSVPRYADCMKALP